ncbi:MAG TPA: DinB family protein [Actinopolymorphaceae bacterium]
MTTWTAPETTRPTGSFTADEFTMLRSDLAWHRATLLHKCAGLTGEQLAQRTVPPSNLSLLGLIRHMAKVERIWFREKFAGQQLPPMYDVAKGKDADFEDLDPTRAEEDYARLLEEMRQADEIASNARLDDTFLLNGEKASLRFIYLHLIGEYARHNGHADLIRERLDGTTGG